MGSAGTRTAMAGGIGEYPAEYNPRIHGPYNPATNYGKADLRLSQVKVGELGAWLGRRHYNPLAMSRAVARGFHRWGQTWLLAKKPSFAGYGQFALALSVFFYITTYGLTKHHRHVKYH